MGDGEQKMTQEIWGVQFSRSNLLWLESRSFWPCIGGAHMSVCRIFSIRQLIFWHMKATSAHFAHWCHYQTWSPIQKPPITPIKMSLFSISLIVTHSDAYTSSESQCVSISIPMHFLNCGICSRSVFNEVLTSPIFIADFLNCENLVLIKWQYFLPKGGISQPQIENLQTL